MAYALANGWMADVGEDGVRWSGVEEKEEASKKDEDPCPREGHVKDRQKQREGQEHR